MDQPVRVCSAYQSDASLMITCMSFDECHSRCCENCKNKHTIPPITINEWFCQSQYILAVSRLVVLPSQAELGLRTKTSLLLRGSSLLYSWMLGSKPTDMFFFLVSQFCCCPFFSGFHGQSSLGRYRRKRCCSFSTYSTISSPSSTHHS